MQLSHSAIISVRKRTNRCPHTRGEHLDRELYAEYGIPGADLPSSVQIERIQCPRDWIDSNIVMQIRVNQVDR